MYVIKLIGLYGIKGDAYFRALGSYGFDFVNDIQYATKFTLRADCNHIIAQKDWYCRMYNAADMIIEEVAE